MDDRLNDVLQRLISDADERLFATRFAALKMSSNDDFVVTLDEVNSWLHLSTRGSAKRAVVRALEKGVHYVHVGRLGDTHMDDIRLTVNGFRLLCTIVRTPRAYVLSAYFDEMMNALNIYFKEVISSTTADIEALRLENAARRSILSATRGTPGRLSPA